MAWRASFEGRLSDIYSKAKARAKKKHLPFTISLEWVRIKLRKAMAHFERLGIPFDFTVPSGRQQQPLAPSLDQIIPGLGYTEENTQIIHWCWNAFKGQYFTDIQAMEHAEKMVSIYQNIKAAKAQALIDRNESRETMISTAT